MIVCFDSEIASHFRISFAFNGVKFIFGGACLLGGGSAYALTLHP